MKNTLVQLSFQSPRGALNLGGVLTLTIVVALVGSAVAAEVGTDSLRMRLHPGPDSVLGIGGATPMQPGVMQSGLLFFGEHHVDLMGEDGELVTAAIQDRVIGDIALGIGFGKGVGITTSIPVVVTQIGRSPATGEALPRESPGDLRVGGHFVLIDPGKNHVGISLQPGVQVPTGSTAAYFSSGMISALAELGLEVRVGPFRALGSVRGEVGFRGPPDSVQIVPGLAYGLGVEVRPHPEWSISAAYSGHVLSFDDWDIPMEIQVGTAVHPEGRLMVGGFCGWGIVSGPGTPAVRAGGQFTIPIRNKPRPEPVTLVQAETHPGGDAADARGAGATSAVVNVVWSTSVQFAQGQALVTEKFHLVLLVLAEYIKNRPDVESIVIVGPIDAPALGPADNGLRRLRAVAVREFLVGEGGVEPSLLSVFQFGDQEDAGIIEREVDHQTVAFLVTTRPIALGPGASHTQ